MTASGSGRDGRHADPWPSLPLVEWKDTYATLHRWTQIVGKIRMAQSPWINHSWHVTLYLTARGLTTSPLWHGARTFQIDFDFIDHRLLIQSGEGAVRTIALRPRPVADFYRELFATLRELGLEVKITRRRTSSRTRSRSTRTGSTRRTMPNTPIASGVCWCNRTGSSRPSAAASSASAARCTSSGAAATWR